MGGGEQSGPTGVKHRGDYAGLGRRWDHRAAAPLRPELFGDGLSEPPFDLPAETQEQHGQGWDHYMERLVIAGEGRDPGPDPWVSSGEMK